MTITIDKKYFEKFGFAEYLIPKSDFKITFGENLTEITEQLKDSLVLGLAEYLCGATALHKDNGYQEADSLSIPTDFNIRGGIFSVQVDFDNKTANISGYISGGTFEENPNPIINTYFGE